MLGTKKGVRHREEIGGNDGDKDVRIDRQE